MRVIELKRVTDTLCPQLNMGLKDKIINTLDLVGLLDKEILLQLQEAMHCTEVSKAGGGYIIN